MDSSEIEKRRQAYELEDRVYDLQPSEVEKRKLLYEHEEEFWKLIRKRAIWGTLLGLGAIYAIAQGVVERVAGVPLKAIEKKLTEAELLAERAKTDAATAEGALAQMNAQLSLRQKDVQDLQEKVTGVEKRFGLVTEQTATADNAARRSTLDFKAPQERIFRLEALVKQIGDENKDTKKAYADYKKEIDKITADAARDQKRFAENSQYTVVIRFSPEQRPLAQQVQNVLANAGFKVPLAGGLPPPGAQGPTDPATGEQWKGNSLTTYSPESEMKAQEILALIKPILKDVRLRLLEPPKIPSVPGRPPPPPLPPEIIRNQFFITLGS